MRNQKVKFKNKIGQELAAIINFPEEEIKSYALFAHCFTCNKDLAVVRNLSRALTQAGFGVMRFDFTGLGRSGGEFSDTSFAHNIQDIIDVAAYLDKHYTAPTLMIGHSLGGIAANLFAATYKEEIGGVVMVDATHPDVVLKIFNKETKVWHSLYDDPNAKQRLDTSIELQKKAIEIQQVQINGVSDNPGVKLGSIVIIEYAPYRITNVTHTNEQNGNYQNKFEAVTAEFDAYPNTNINAFPKSETQTAIVIENADPEGLGRIQVQFPWQKLFGGNTPWLRIVSPHAGGNKGFHFIE